MQPISGSDHLRITAAGSAVIKNASATVKTITFNPGHVGTVELYDHPSGTATANPLTIGTVSTVMLTLEPNLAFDKGIYYVATGTPNLTIGFI